MIGQSMMHRALARGPLRGERIDALTGEAVDLWFATERDRRRIDWIATQLTTSAQPAWRALGLSVARAEIFDADGRMCWQPMPGDDRSGEPVIVVPVWVHDEGHWAGATVIDLLAVNPNAPERVASRTGACQALGEIAVEGALADGAAIVWFRDALAWLRAGGDGHLMLGVESVARFCPLNDDADIVERVLLQAREIHAESVEHGEWIATRVRAARKRLLPRMPDIMVVDALSEAA